jgi:hypothetical protein
MVYRPATPQPPRMPPPLAGREVRPAPARFDLPQAAMAWGEYCIDQADGFAPAADDMPLPDLDDDRGYGFGV